MLFGAGWFVMERNAYGATSKVRFAPSGLPELACRPFPGLKPFALMFGPFGIGSGRPNGPRILGEGRNPGNPSLPPFPRALKGVLRNEN